MRSPRLALSALVAALLAMLLLPLTATPASAAPTIVGVALDEQGRPLENVGWEVYELQGGQWVGQQFGPKLTDSNGRFSWGGAVAGKGYRVCFLDDYYGEDGSSATPAYWFPEVRHRNTCWNPSATSTSVGTARTWTAPASGSGTFTLRMPRAGLGQAPVDPFMTGTFEVGKPITLVGMEGWRPTDAALSYAWFRDNVAIAGATAATYTPTAADSGKWIHAAVTGTRAGYKTARATSQVTKVGGTHAQLAPPTISGTAAAGRTLTASFVKPASSHSFIDWFVDGIPQPAASTQGQSSATFAVTPAMAGARIEARVHVYLLDGSGNYIDGSNAFSRASVAVAGTRPAQPLPVRVAPAVSTSPVAGAAAVGATLSAPRASADPAATTTYQWLRGSAPIAGATAPTYALKRVDMGQRIAVAVKVSRPGWWSPFVGTSRTTDVVRGVLPAATVKVKGATRVGARLTAKVAGWKGLKVTYRWLRNGKAIKPAKKAKKASYVVTRKDRGKRITVVATATKASHLPATATSKAKKIKR